MIIAVACAAAGTIAAKTSDDANRAPMRGVRHERAFQDFLNRYGKVYCDAENTEAVCKTSLHRQKVYFANMVTYEKHNSNERASYRVRETKFSDLTEEEFAQRWLTYTPVKSLDTALGVGLDIDEPAESTLGGAEGETGLGETKGKFARRARWSRQQRERAQANLRAQENRQGQADTAVEGASDASGGLGATGEPPKGYPEQFTWRSPPAGYGNVVGLVHDQQDMCASCWAFVTADSIASRIAVINKGDDAPRLSVKQLMACDDIDHACSTGNMYTAYEWLGQHGGISTMEDYNEKVPGEREDDPEAQCAAEAEHKYNTPAMCDLEQVLGEEPLYRAIYERGPVAVGINANRLQAYDDGVIMMDDCHPLGRGISSINHAVLVVGWGVTKDGIKYWELKNSYGPKWGDQGFFKLERGRIGAHGFGTCGLLFESVYPIVTTGKSAPSTDALCVEGSVQKVSYYRNETLNPGAGLGDDTDINQDEMGAAMTPKSDSAKLALNVEPRDTDVAPLSHVKNMKADKGAKRRGEYHAIMASLGNAQTSTGRSNLDINIIAPFGACVALIIAVVVAARRQVIESHEESAALLAENVPHGSTLV